MVLFAISDLNVKFREKIILRNIQCNIPKNKVTVILGPSGSGKTTLLKSIVRLVDSTGIVLLNGNNIENVQIAELRKQVVYVSQIPSMFSGSVKDNIMTVQDISEINIDAENLLEIVGLSQGILQSNASELSLGQQQRVHLARALALRPKVLLLDEPASALDAISKEGIEKLVMDLVAKNNELSVIIVTHDINQAKSIADYIILLDNGKMKLEGIANNFFGQINDLNDADTLRWLLGEGDINKESIDIGN